MAKDKRLRRSKEEARAQILECARRHLEQIGPVELSLDAIADEVGMTRSTVAYHFSGKDGLLEELIVDYAKRRNAQAGSLDIDDRPVSEDELAALLAGFLDSNVAGGAARFNQAIAFLKLHDGDISRWARDSRSWLAEFFHVIRTQAAAERGSALPTREDTRFLALLLWFVTWADSIVGEEARAAFGLEDRASDRQRFYEWLGRLAARARPILELGRPAPAPKAKKRSTKKR